MELTTHKANIMSKELSVTLDNTGLTESEKLELVAKYFELETSHVKQDGKEAMQKDLIKTFNQARASHE